ncbi:MAG: hypothetical protein SPL08_04285, partial [Pseudomonadota bacterium]|nr:hypothetical protein [Pseudomonadota bacterium]
MTLKQRINNTWRKGRILRYRTYKRMGIVRHRKKADVTLLLLLIICLAVFPFFVMPKGDKETCPEVQIPEPIITEEVHPDLGDEPVVPASRTSLDELEKRVQLGELK